MRQRFPRSVPLIAALSAASVQADEQHDYFSLSLEELLQVEVNVASRTDEQILSAPSTVTVFTRDEIDLLGVRTVLELLDHVPGLTVTADSRNAQNAPNIHVRGIQRGDFGTHVLILVDGQRINQPTTGGANLSMRLFSAGQVEKIEVVRGPGSALYGSNAFLAVVDITTNRDDARVQLLSSGDEGGELSARASLRGKPGELSFYAHVRDDDGVEKSVLGEMLRDPVENEEIGVRARRGNWTLDLRYADAESFDQLLFYSSGPGVNRARAQWIAGQLGGALRLRDGLRLRMRAGYMRERQHTLSRAVRAGEDLGYGPLPADFQGGPYEVGAVADANLELDAQLGANHDLLVGASIIDERVPTFLLDANYVGAVPDPSLYLGDVVRQSTPFTEAVDGHGRFVVAGYAQDRYRITSQWTGFAGVRVDHYEEIGSSVNPRAALIYRPRSQLSLKFQYGSAFRAPSINERRLGSPITIPNPDLEPEKLDTYEAGAAWRGSKGSLQANFFHTDIRDEIVDTIVSGRTVTRINGGDRHLQGVELQGTLQPWQGLRLVGVWTEIVNGAADDSFERLLGLRAYWQFRRLNVSLANVYRGEQPDLPSQDPYWVSDLQLNLRISDNAYMLLRAENVFDTPYDSYGAGFPANDFRIPQRGREVLIGARILYKGT